MKKRTKVKLIEIVFGFVLASGVGIFNAFMTNQTLYYDISLFQRIIFPFSIMFIPIFIYFLLPIRIQSNLFDISENATNR